MNIVGKSYVNVTIKDFNKLLAWAEKHRIFIHRPYYEGDSVSMRAYIEEKQVCDTLTMTGPDGNVHTYIAYKDGRAMEQGHASPLNVISAFSKYYKIPHLYDDKEDAPFSAGPFLYFNPRHNMTRQFAYGYDQNSAYTYALLTARLPDCTRRLPSGIVGCDEVGFGLNGEMVETGRYSMFRFPLMAETDRERIRKFCNVWYNRKRNSKSGSPEHTKAKDYLNIIIGAFQLHCCYLRSAVINFSDRLMLDIIEKEGDDILLSNTDSIVSVKKLDLKIGKELGDWKFEHRGDFAYQNYDYQWGDGKIATRGHSHSTIGPDFDILQGNYYINGNEWKFDYGTNREVKIDIIDSKGQKVKR